MSRGFQRNWYSLVRAKDMFPDAVHEFASAHPELRDSRPWNLAFDHVIALPNPYIKAAPPMQPQPQLTLASQTQKVVPVQPQARPAFNTSVHNVTTEACDRKMPAKPAEPSALSSPETKHTQVGEHEESHLIQTYFAGLLDSDVEHLWPEIDQASKAMEDAYFAQVEQDLLSAPEKAPAEEKEQIPLTAYKQNTNGEIVESNSTVLSE